MDQGGLGVQCALSRLLLEDSRAMALVQRGARENGLRYDSSYADLGVRDAEITAHAAFRKRLYDHDVVLEAQAASASLRWVVSSTSDWSS
jgi:salicylate hydroxylase